MHHIQGAVWGGLLQAIGVHGLASVELEVLEVGQEILLDVGLGALLEGSDGLGISTLLLEGGLDSLEVACAACQYGRVAAVPSRQRIQGFDAPLR